MLLSHCSVGLARREDVLAGAVDERRERLDGGRRPVADPVVVGAAAEQDVVLRLDRGGEVREHLVAAVEHPVARLLGHTVERQELVEDDVACHRWVHVSSTRAGAETHRGSLKGMSVTASRLFAFDDSFVRELEGLSVPWQGAAVAAPRMLALNEPFAAELGADSAALRAETASRSAGSGAAGVAQVYAGHQFGAYSGRLGDGRALLLGEVRRPRPPPEGLRADAVRARRGRQGRRRPDAARVRDRRGDARARDPDLARARRRDHRRAGDARRRAVPGRRAGARGGEPHPGRHVRVRVGARRRLSRRLADYSIRRHFPDADSLPGLLHARGRRAGVADRPLDARRVHPRRDEHRQHGDLGRDDRLRAVRVHGRLSTRRRSTARSTTAGATRTATSRTSRRGTWRGSPRRCCRSSTTTATRRSPR